MKHVFIFINKNNLDYVGDIPDYKYFYNYFDLKNYTKYIELSSKYKEKKKWNLIEETIKYMTNDVIELYEIVDKFSRDAFIEGRINVTDILSISSLAFNTF